MADDGGMENLCGADVRLGGGSLMWLDADLHDGQRHPNDELNRPQLVIGELIPTYTAINYP